MTVPYDIIAEVMAVLTRISSGKVPTVACDEQGLSYNTFVSYTTPNGRFPELARMRHEAEDRLYDQMAEALPHIFTHPVYGVTDPKEAGVVSANIKWLLARRRRDAYGDHSTVEMHVTADREVLDALQKAKARAQGGTIIDQVVNELLIDRNVVDADVIEDTRSERLEDLY